MTEKISVLIADDDTRMRELLCEIFTRQGYGVTCASDGGEALQHLDDSPFSLVITDLMMPQHDGIAILNKSMAVNPEVPVILLTAHGSVDTAIAAMKQGAYDYIEKPFDPDQLLLQAKRAVNYYLLNRRVQHLDRTIEQIRSHELVGSGGMMRKLKEQVAKIAPLDVAALLQGETGTGKELVARLIHRLSSRAEHRFLPINCSAVAESLLESELFGYERGAFTGAEKQKKGLVEDADRGTLFLDEINAMPHAFQAKMLRFLQDQTYIRVGGTSEMQADVRVIAATNVDLEEKIATKTFRDDLYYRLKGVLIKIPPLRDRVEDIPELAFYFLSKYSRLYQKDIKKIDRRALDLLMDYPWPGNVRELENIIGSAVITAEGASLTTACLPEGFGKGTQPLLMEESLNLSSMEQRLIRKALEKTGGNKARAARLLGIDTTTLWRKLK